MASSLLAKLKVKPIPAKQESIVVKINKPEPAFDEKVDIRVKIEDKSKQKLVNRDSFLQKMKEVRETVTKIPEKSKQETKPLSNNPEIPGQSYMKSEDAEPEAESDLDPENKLSKEKSIFIVKPKKVGKLVLVPCLDIGKLTYKSEMPLALSPKTMKDEKKTKLKIVDEEDEGEESKRKTGKTIATKKKTGEELGVYKGDTKELKPEMQDIFDNLPDKSEQILIKADSYYLNSRKYFVNFISTLFAPYKKELEEDEEKLTCDSMTGEFSLLTHQKLVRDYINIYTPYRGILLYHGLGSGKTCSSIAIAEGIKTEKKVLIMTPASLQSNYRKELMKCGDNIYKKNQAWEFIQTKGDPEMINKFSSEFGLTVKYINARKGVWVVNKNKEANYNSMDTTNKASIDDQIKQMIENKYEFLNYNGLRMDNLSVLTQQFENNYFDNKVVIIDEAHNLISRIVNKIKSKGHLSTKCRLDQMGKDGDLGDFLKEDIKNKHLSTILYKLLMTAKNAKIILLTGTPIINYPNEIAILFNILRGCIKTYSFKLVINAEEKINNERIIQILNKNKKIKERLDYIEYKSSSTTLLITQNPFSYVNNVNDSEEGGVVLSKDDGDDDEEFIKLIRKTLDSYKIKIAPSGISIDGYKALPDTLEEFNNYFIGDNNNVKNEIMLKRRILGLTSFVMDKEKLMPEYSHTEGKDFYIVKLPMSDFQFGIYEEARVQERNIEKNNNKKKKLGAMTGGIYDDSVSTYRIFSRAFCNFVFPKPYIKRPMPIEKDNINEKTGIETLFKKENLNEDILDALSAEERVQNIDGKYETDEIKELKDQMVDAIDVTYEKRLKDALVDLEKNSDKYLTKEALKTYSPKFLSILENIQNPDHIGLHLIYSQFRTLEGIGILELVLKENGMQLFDIKRNEKTNKWELNIENENMGKPMFALYTGKEDTEKKEIIRNIYNSNWSIIPDSLKTQLERISSNNLYGEIIKVLMITASGAEGIDLKNVRYVHITESYWHPVRMEQVIGRAKRICSHNKLPPKLQTVEVFLYLMTFSQEQLNSDKSIELRLKDTGKTKETRSMPLTSDEALYEISTIKENINKNILKSVKESAIDCTLNTRGKDGEKLQCFSFGLPDKKAYSYVPSITSEETDRVAKQNVASVTFKAVEVTINKIKYALNKETNDVYDLQSYKDAVRNKGFPIKVGSLEKKGDKFEFIELK